jgi:hypothetical protein
MNIHQLIKKPTRKVARTITGNPHVELLARLGYAANGIIHGLIGAVVIAIAFGSTGEADQSGVLGPLGYSMYGKALLLLIFVGLVSLGIWKIATVVLMRKTKLNGKLRRRLEEGAKASVYLVLGLSSIAFLFNHTSTSSSIASSQQITQALLHMPIGVPLLYLVCFVLAAVGIGLIIRGANRRFLDTLDSNVHVSLNYLAVLCGVAGYVAKGVVFIVLAGIFLNAALTFDPSKASGLDGAFKSFMALPFGASLLFVVGMGFVMYAIYSVARSRLAEM